jgi:hypothetical protein
VKASAADTNVGQQAYPAIMATVFSASGTPALL